MNTKDYKKAFEELQRFNRDMMGDSAWLNWYISDSVSCRWRGTVIVPSGRYYITEPIRIPTQPIDPTIEGTLVSGMSFPPVQVLKW